MKLDKECEVFEKQLLHQLCQIRYLKSEELTPSQQDAVVSLGVKAFREYIIYFRDKIYTDKEQEI